MFFFPTFSFSIDFNDSIRFDSQAFDKNKFHRMKRDFFSFFSLVKTSQKNISGSNV